MDNALLRSLATRLDDAGMGAWRVWIPILIVVVAWLALIAILLFLLKRVDYRIGPRHLIVTILGIPVRRVRLDNIRNVHTRRSRFAEKWHNVLVPTFDRILVIEKRRGIIKRFLITPEQRYVFKAELDRAIRAHLGLKPGPTVGDVATFDKLKAPAEGAFPEGPEGPASSPSPPRPADNHP